MTSGKARLLREVEILARTYTNLAINTLVRICEMDDAPEAARVQAAKTLLDRGWGKAPQVVEVSTPVGDLADDDLSRRIADRLAGIVRAAGSSASGSGIAGDAGGAASPGSEVKSPRVVH